MSWVFEHLQVIIFVAGIIAYWLNQRRRDKAGQDADYDGDGKPDNPHDRRKIDPNQPDPEEADRMRRAQEDIRRKIAERQGGSATSGPLPRRPTANEPPPVPKPVPAPQPRRPHPTMAPTPTAEGPLPEMLRRMLDPNGEIQERARARVEAAERAARERMQAMEVEIRQAQERQQLEAERAAAFRAASAASAPSASSGPDRASTRGPLLDDLRRPGSLKRAVVLREVLGPPVGLR